MITPPVNISSPLSSSDLQEIKNSIVGDQFAKLQLFLSNQSLIRNLIEVATSNLDLKREALDILLSLLNLEEDVRYELNEIYSTIVELILRDIKITLNDSDVITYKNIKLVNICLENYGEELRRSGPTLSSFSARNLQHCLLHYIEKWLTTETSVYHSAVIVALMTSLLKDIGKVTRELKDLTERLLTRISQKYIDQLEFKYLLKVSSKPNKMNQIYDPLSNKGVENSATMQFITSPNPVDIHDPVDRSMFYLGVNLYLQIFESPRSRKADFFFDENAMDDNLWKDGNFGLFLSSFLKSDDMNMKCSAVKFAAFPYLCSSRYKLPKQPLRQWLPSMLDCFNYDNIPWWFDPFEILTNLIDLYNHTSPLNNPVTDFLFKTSLLNGLVSLFAKCLCLPYQNRGSINVVAKFIKLCASITSFDEKCRELLLEDKSLLLHAESGLESHLNLLDSFLENKDTFSESLEPELFPPLHDSSITLSWLLLLKSFSRSITALRTSLKRNRLAELLLSLVKRIYLLITDINFKGAGFLKAEISILSATLGVLSNFVVEFSNLQSFILSNGIVDVVGSILREPLFNSKIPWEDEVRREKFTGIATSEVKTNALWVLRHLMYNSHNEEKIELLSSIPMELILQFVNDSNWLVQEQCFQLLRNLTCNSRRIVNILLGNFKDSDLVNNGKKNAPAVRSTYLFEFLAHKMKLLDPSDSHQRKTLEGVLYIIVNITAINENKRQLIIEQDDLLHIIYEILSDKDGEHPEAGTNNDLQIACLWILTNLIWNSSFSSYAHHAPEDYIPSMETSPVRIGSSSGDESNDKATSQDNDEHLDEEISGDEDEDMENEDPDEGDEFVRPYPQQSAVKTKNSALERCSKLVKMGMYDLVKLKTFDKHLAVREKARTLLFHMDLLRKGM
ncbi:LAFE_0D06172g1_1 [Lachancea fermentati]|uniref:LAFE_0D06172g1_1 n=1 Tax=Lachancea fermentati TaxID=4955 RepID=A0A1G4MBB5_LACFM|nr:LAFE_0D06172g1_1 [Lachancea fermentati]